MPAQPMDAQHSVKEVRTDEPEQVLSWSCIMGDDKFLGESKIFQTYTADTWYSESREKKHVQINNSKWITDSNYEGSAGKEEAITHHAILDGDEYGVFEGTNEGKATTYSYIVDNGQVELSIKNIDGEEYIDVPVGSKTFKDAMDQKSRIDFGPPCPKPSL